MNRPAPSASSTGQEGHSTNGQVDDPEQGGDDSPQCSTFFDDDIMTRDARCVAPTDAAASVLVAAWHEWNRHKSEFIEVCGLGDAIVGAKGGSSEKNHINARNDHQFCCTTGSHHSYIGRDLMHTTSRGERRPPVGWTPWNWLRTSTKWLQWNLHVMVQHDCTDVKRVVRGTGWTWRELLVPPPTIPNRAFIYGQVTQTLSPLGSGCSYFCSLDASHADNVRRRRMDVNYCSLDASFLKLIPSSV
jgi:hypothetical protein